ncbi:hypothetical protein B0H34DRAFT_2539 [Crassisporium funariophilum]|nr:hypothetical protein B0H34DRAFT_2539 [Crassisporium funariophilum]
MDAAVRRGHPIVFGAIVLFSIIEMCIAAWITARYNSRHDFPNSGVRARVRYLLFVSIWTILFGTIYMIMFLVSSSGSLLTSVLSHWVFLTITWILWLAAAAAITQTLGGSLDCRIDTKFVYCGQLNALEGFAWLIWVLLTFLLAFVLYRGIVAARKGDGLRGGLVSV